jgi:hypothetical protein
MAPFVIIYLFFKSRKIPVYSVNVAKNKYQLISNSQLHKINTSIFSHLHKPVTNLTTYQNVAYYQGVKIDNHLPKAIKHLSSNMNTFKLALTKYLLDKSFYSLKE